MTDTTTSTAAGARTPVLDPVTYWRASAFALTLVTLLGIVLGATDNAGLFGAGLAFDWSHTVLHAVLALAAFVFGFAPLPARLARSFAIAFGIVYGGLGILGFLVADLGPIHLELGENLLHVLLGAWALVAGFASR